MNAPIPHAVRNLHLCCGLVPKTVLRADLGRDEEVWLETESRGTRRWFRQADELTEVLPRHDARLPLCAALDWQAPGLEVLAWRPGRRIAIGCREDGRDVVLKGLRKGRLDAAYERYCRVHGALGGALDFVVPAVEADAKRCALRLERLDYEPLGLTHRSESAWQQVGVALASFQRAVPSAGLVRHDFAAELAVLEELAARHRDGMGELPPGWSASWEVLSCLAAPPRTRWVAAHRDLHDGQLLGDGERVALLDFDLLCEASPLLDVANLSVHLMLRAVQEQHGATRADAEGCGRALLLGYDIGDAAEDYRELRAYQAATFLRLALVYSMRPRWRAVVDPLIRYAQRCLDEPHLV